MTAARSDVSRLARMTSVYVTAASMACSHESEWRPSSVAHLPSSYSADPVAERAVATPVPCGPPGARARFDGAADPPQLCAILARIRDSFSTIASDRRRVFPPAMREQLRAIVEKCRSDLRLETDELARHSRSTFRVLLDERGALSLATSDDDVNGDRFTRCATLAMRARSNTTNAGALYEFVVPPIPLRWWPDPRSPQSSIGLLW